MLTRLYLLYSERNIVNIMHIGLLALQLQNSAKCVRLYYSPPLPPWPPAPPIENDSHLTIFLNCQWFSIANAIVSYLKYFPIWQYFPIANDSHLASLRHLFPIGKYLQYCVSFGICEIVGINIANIPHIQHLTCISIQSLIPSIFPSKPQNIFC